MFYLQAMVREIFLDFDIFNLNNGKREFIVTPRQFLKFRLTIHDGKKSQFKTLLYM
jgi:hypothetical protein